MGKAEWETMSGIVLVDEYRNLIESTNRMAEARRLLGQLGEGVIPDSITAVLAGVHLQLIKDRREISEYLKNRILSGDAAAMTAAAGPFYRGLDMEQEE